MAPGEAEGASLRSLAGAVAVALKVVGGEAGLVDMLESAWTVKAGGLARGAVAGMAAGAEMVSSMAAVYLCGGEVVGCGVGRRVQ